jgi:hypothetical protein
MSPHEYHPWPIEPGIESFLAHIQALKVGKVTHRRQSVNPRCLTNARTIEVHALLD